MRFRGEMAASVPPTMRFPEEIALLCDWVEVHGHIVIHSDGSRVGLMHVAHASAPDDLDADVPGGTNLQLKPEGATHMAAWFGGGADVEDRVSVFAQTGGEGSMAAFWRAPDGTQKIVHLGSGSGSTLVCVLAETPVDFLRLIAIGYDEICWDEKFNARPNEGGDEDKPRILPHKAFQAWVRKTFKVTIPKTASEIVKHPSSIDSARSEDPFWNWVKKNPTGPGRVKSKAPAPHHFHSTFRIS